MKTLSGGSLEWTDGMLYPVLQRMEMDGYIASAWRTPEGQRPRRYYTLTDRGRRELARELTSWKRIWDVLASLTTSFSAGEVL